MAREQTAQRRDVRANTRLSRRAFVSQLAALGAAAAISSCAPSPTPRLRRIGFLSGNTHASVEELSPPFVQQLHELGYVDGRDISIEFKIADNINSLLPSMASELIALPVDVLVAQASPAQLAAKAATTTVPIVFVLGGDPVGQKIVASMNRPGGNVTGVTTLSTELSAKKVEYLREVVPSLSRVAVIYNANNGTITQAQAAKEAGRTLGVTVEIFGVHDDHELDAVLATIAKEQFDGLVMTPALSVIRSYSQVPEFAAALRMPQIYSDVEIVRAGGGLMHLGANYAAMHRAAAVMVDRILKGAKPADMPVEQPIEFEFIVNKAAARRIGFKIPASVLARASDVIP
jgi:putative ABC transport system substrate-binding protein